MGFFFVLVIFIVIFIVLVIPYAVGYQSLELYPCLPSTPVVFDNVIPLIQVIFNDIFPFQLCHPFAISHCNIFHNFFYHMAIVTNLLYITFVLNVSTEK